MKDDFTLVEIETFPLSFYARSDHKKSKETFKQENEDGITFSYLIKFHPMRLRKGSKMGYLYSYQGFFIS